LSEFEDVLFGDMGLAKSQPMSGVAAVKITSDGKNKVIDPIVCKTIEFK
jgi:hypothetical protein